MSVRACRSVRECNPGVFLIGSSISAVTRFQVVIPSLDQGRFIGAAVRSVLAQSADVDVELVVVDACSTDRTAEEIDAALGTVRRARAKVIREPDDGQSQAINKGMRHGSGEIVSWLNADDVLLPGTLKRVDALFAELPSDVVAIYGDLRYIDEAGRPLSRFRAQPFRLGDVLWGRGYVPQPSTFVRRTAWEAVGGLREDLSYAMDTDLWLRLCEVGRFVHVPEVFSEFRFHPSSKTVASLGRLQAEAIDVQRTHAERHLGRMPSRAETRLRGYPVRTRRKLFAAREALRRRLRHGPSGRAARRA